MEVEYYSKAEWEIIRQNARVDSQEDQYRSARELVCMVEQRGILAEECFRKGIEKITFDSYDGLTAYLNDYVGDNGRFTPLVKAVTVYLNKQELAELSIVDTPGLNDPVPARTCRTRQFMEACDVVFFLSQSGKFLDKKDWELLSSQLPQEGVKKLVLIASKYDSAVCDILREPDSGSMFEEDDDAAYEIDDDDDTAHDIKTACSMIQRKLGERACEKTAAYERELAEKGGSKEIIAVIRQCSKPVFVSSMAQNMADRQTENLQAEEEVLYDRLYGFSNNIDEDLQLLGNFAEVRRIFQEVVSEKDRILARKEKTLLSDAESELMSLLSGFAERAKARLNILKNGDLSQLAEQKKAVERQMGSIRADIASVFGSLSGALEQGRSHAEKELREEAKDYYHINERTGSETKTKAYRTGFLWLIKKYHTYEEHYSYFLAADALENIHKYTADAINLAESVFSEALQLKKIKGMLLDAIVNDFDTGSEEYDSAFYRCMVEETVSGIELPSFQLQVKPEKIQDISQQFTGELVTPESKTELAAALSRVISEIQEEIRHTLVSRVDSYKKELKGIAEKMQGSLLDQVKKEFQELSENYKNKEQEMIKYQTYIQAVQEQEQVVSAHVKGRSVQI